ncbi:MAG: hypothetical protein M1816_001078 [Peltula sp. TS41687]|nr:MAG: hypothetical protein M1816_001078 [Peltula sp. TS41687]
MRALQLLYLVLWTELALALPQFVPVASNNPFNVPPPAEVASNGDLSEVGSDKAEARVNGQVMQGYIIGAATIGPPSAALGFYYRARQIELNKCENEQWEIEVSGELSRFEEAMPGQRNGQTDVKGQEANQKANRARVEADLIDKNLKEAILEEEPLSVLRARIKRFCREKMKKGKDKNERAERLLPHMSGGKMGLKVKNTHHDPNQPARKASGEDPGQTPPPPSSNGQGTNPTPEPAAVPDQTMSKSPGAADKASGRQPINVASLQRAWEKTVQRGRNILHSATDNALANVGHVINSAGGGAAKPVGGLMSSPVNGMVPAL